MKEVILDIETTGLSPQEGHRIVEIAALEMKNKALTGKKFHFYVNPERNIPEEAYRIHGISSEFLKNKPLFRDIADELLEFIGSSALVIHNAVFDISFINHELSLLKKPSIELTRAIDTLIIARKMFPGMRTNLDALCKRFGIDNSFRQFHGALKDTVLLAEVYVELSGGRQAKFNIDTRSMPQILANKNQVSNSSNRTPIIRPTKEELKNHKEFLASIMAVGWMN